MGMATTTIRPGEVTSAQLEHQHRPPPPEWLLVADHVIDRLPSVAAKLGPLRSGLGAHVAMLWIVVAVLAVGSVYHLIGDGTLRDKVERTECHVEWLVEREVARDRGEPPPPFSPLACSR
jgi:hypothetical protein